MRSAQKTWTDYIFVDNPCSHMIQLSADSEKQPLCGDVLPSTNHSELNEQLQLHGNTHTAVYVRRKSSVAKLAIQRLVRTRERLWATTIFATVSAIPALLVGYTLGFSSSALLELTDKTLLLDRQFSDLLSSLFGAFASVGALFGGPITGWIADHWGRKMALLFAGVPYLVGYLMIALAHLIGDATAFKAVLLTGRLLTGVGMGCSYQAVPVYHGEISSAKLRGIYGSFTQIFLGIGIVLVFGVGSIEGFHYYYLALVAAGIVTAFELMMVWLKETPRWLLSKGYKLQTVAALKILRGPKIGFEKELKDMEVVLTEDTNLSMLQVLKEFKRRSVLIPFLILAVIMFFQMIGGISALSPYAATIFKEAGVPHPKLASIYSIGSSALLVIVTIVLVDIAGRKVLLVVSGIGNTLSSVMLGTHFFLTRPSLCHSNFNLSVTLLQSTATTDAPCNPQYAPLAIVSVFLFCAFFSVGWGPIPWVLLGEMLPLQVRGMASGIVAIVGSSTAAIATGFYPKYSETVTPWFAWWSFAVVNLISVLFVVFCVFETKGRTLEEIQRKYEEREK